MNTDRNDGWTKLHYRNLYTHRLNQIKKINKMELLLAFILLTAVFSIGFLVGAKQENKRLNPKP